MNTGAIPVRQQQKWGCWNIKIAMPSTNNAMSSVICQSSVRGTKSPAYDTLRTVIHANTWHEELIRPHGTHHTPLLPVACQTETRYRHYLRKSSDARPKSGPAIVFARRKIEGGPHLYLKPIENKRVFRASKFSPKNSSRITFGELLPFNCQTILPFRSSELIVD